MTQQYIWLAVDECVRIGDAVVMNVQCPQRHGEWVDRHQCRLGVQAPRSVPIVRSELLDRAGDDPCTRPPHPATIDDGS